MNQRMNLKKLLECVDDSIKRMNANLINIKNDFECKLLKSTSEFQFMNLNIKENKNSTLNVLRIIYSTSSTNQKKSVIEY